MTLRKMGLAMGALGLAAVAGVGGKTIADFVVLDRNPLTTPVEQIRAIKVLETVKEGQTVWQRS